MNSNSSFSGTAAGYGFSVGVTDVICATVYQYGKTVLSDTFSGCGTVSELISRIITSVKGLTGLVTISLRNRTWGTTQRRVIRLGGSQRRRMHASDGVQLTLSFGDAA